VWIWVGYGLFFGWLVAWLVS